MAAYIGSVEGSRGPARRMGGEASGVSSALAGWNGGVITHLNTRDGIPWLRIELVTHRGQGRQGVVYDGPLADIPLKGKG